MSDLSPSLRLKVICLTKITKEKAYWSASGFQCFQLKSEMSLPLDRLRKLLRKTVPGHLEGALHRPAGPCRAPEEGEERDPPKGFKLTISESMGERDGKQTPMSFWDDVSDQMLRMFSILQKLLLGEVFMLSSWSCTEVPHTQTWLAGQSLTALIFQL